MTPFRDATDLAIPFFATQMRSTRNASSGQQRNLGKRTKPFWIDTSSDVSERWNIQERMFPMTKNDDWIPVGTVSGNAELVAVTRNDFEAFFEKVFGQLN